MPEIKHHELSALLSPGTKAPIPQAVVIWGQGYLTRQAFDAVIKRLLPGNKQSLGYELLEGEDAVVPVILERLSTYSMMLDRRVIALRDAPLFLKQNVIGFSPLEIESLQKFIEKDIPENHFLVMTTQGMDRRKALFKTVKKKGLAIDCSIPEGSRKADKMAQDNLLRQIVKKRLARAGKNMNGDGLSLMMNNTGFDPDTLAENLDKLIAFTGVRNTITIDDVRAIVKRTKIDAVFEFTNAVADRDTGGALFYLTSLLKSGLHPLQILTALTNQVRKLLNVKCFIEKSRHSGGGCWSKGQDYNYFRQATMADVVKHDLALSARSKKLDHHLKRAGSQKGTKKKGSKTDLLIAPNPKNSYPVFHTFLKSDGFTLTELYKAVSMINEVDYRMKSSGSDPEILLEDLVIRLIGKGRSK